MPGVTATRRRDAPLTTSTAKPPPRWAMSAVTGTASTSRTRLCSSRTVTGAWSSEPLVLKSLIVTRIVAVPLPPPLPPPPPPPPESLDDGAVATRPTEPIRPCTTLPDGNVTLTRAPTRAIVDFAVSRSTATTRRVDVVVITGVETEAGAWLRAAEDDFAALRGVLARLRAAGLAAGA